MFHRIGWHLGNGRRTWGETYGVTIGRAYLSFAVQHVNLIITPEEANE